MMKHRYLTYVEEEKQEEDKKETSNFDKTVNIRFANYSAMVRQQNGESAIGASSLFSS